jgi:putative transposase
MQQFKGKERCSVLLNWVELPKSVYHYKPKQGKKGAKPSEYTVKKDGTICSNQQVIESIKSTLSGEFVCYGYQNITVILKEEYIINHKKVYRLMDVSNLLFGKVIKTSGKREFVRYRKINAIRPMEHLCLDIKYVWVHGERRNYYLLSIIDVYSRKILRWIFQKSIRKMDVINLFRSLNVQYGIKDVYIRNDNGSQFIANDVKQFLKSVEAKQEFTHIATPEENSYIEAFHSIVQREVIDRYEFLGGYDAKTVFQRYMKWYNDERRHGKLGRITPQQKWDQGVSLLTDRPPIERIAEGLSRPDSESRREESALYSLDKPGANAYLCLSDHNEKSEMLQNLSEKSV